MKEHPMLFSAPMVRALLAGTKTQTRRLRFRGAVGDRIWVKETHHRCPHCSGDAGASGAEVAYRAGGWLLVGGERDDNDDRPLRPKCAAHCWRPSIFMWRWASRITLEVTALRHELLQDISAEDSLAEGVPRASSCGCEVCRHSVQMCPADASEQIMAYAALWDSLNEKHAPWSLNPTVDVVAFKRLVP